MQETARMESNMLRQRLDYFQTITTLIRAPRAFFSDMPDQGWQLPAKICGISAIFHVVVSCTYIFGRSVPLAVVLLCNAMLMPLITASLTYMFMTMFMGRKTSLSRMYAVFALASAPVLLISWVPAVGMITEPWRMLLIGFGLNKACSLSWKQSALLVLLAFAALLLFIWSALPVLTDLKHVLFSLGEEPTLSQS